MTAIAKRHAEKRQRPGARGRRSSASARRQQNRGPSIARSGSCRVPLLTGANLLPAAPTARVFGYARVSTEDQNLDVQLAALRGNGVQEAELMVEKVSAMNAKRPLFNLMMKLLEHGDSLIVHSLSRLGRDVKQIYGILDELARIGVTWRSLTEPHLDTATAAGRLMLNVTGAMAQFERDQIRERTTRGMQERKRQGMWLGRKAIVSDADARRMVGMRRRKMTGEQIAARFRHLNIKASTVYARTNVLMRASAKKQESYNDSAQANVLPRGTSGARRRPHSDLRPAASLRHRRQRAGGQGQRRSRSRERGAASRSATG